MSTVCEDTDSGIIGVVGLDLRPEKLLDQVINFDDDSSLAFFIDQHGQNSCDKSLRNCPTIYHCHKIMFLIVIF